MLSPFVMRYAVTPRHLTVPSRRRSGRAMFPGVRFVVAHDTGNQGSTASANVAYLERTCDKEGASAHLFVDDREILECIPALTGPPEKAWHVRRGSGADGLHFGSDADDAAIGVEYCFGREIDPDEAYRRYVWVIAYACHHHALDPAAAVVGHFFLDPERRTDPCTGLARSRRTYEGLLRDVASEFLACRGGAPPSTFHPGPGMATSTARLNLRRGRPDRRAEVVRVVPPGTSLLYEGWDACGEPVNGNPKWFRDREGNWFWSGATR
jgi:N-acetylmuramoyl-L-alanine amidase